MIKHEHDVTVFSALPFDLFYSLQSTLCPYRVRYEELSLFPNIQ